jgi:hypothetical protein
MPDKLVELEIRRWVEEKKCTVADCTECGNDLNEDEE